MLRGRVRDFRIAAILAGAVPLAVSITVASLDVSRAVGLVFGVAASTLCPLLVLGIWWRGLTVAGAATGLIAGGVVAAGATTVSVLGGVSDHLWDGWPAVVLDYPAAISVPLSFASMVLVSRATRHQAVADVSHIFTRLHAPERLGMGADRERELRSD